MPIRDTPQIEDAKRKVAPNVVGRRRPFRVRGTNLQLPTGDTTAQDRFLSRRVAEATDERKEMDNLLRASFSNKLRDLSNKSLEKVLVSEGVTAPKEWNRAQEHYQKELDILTRDYNSDELKMINPLIERSTVDFTGTGSRHVANEMHKAGKVEYKKVLAGRQDDLIRLSGSFTERGGIKSDFGKQMNDLIHNRGEVFDNMARLAKMEGHDLNTIKEQKKALITDTVVKAMDYNLGNGNFNNAKSIFKEYKDFIDPEVHDELQKKLDTGEELNYEDIGYQISRSVRQAYPNNAKKRREVIHQMARGNAKVARYAINFHNMDDALIKKEEDAIKKDFNIRTFQNNQANYANKVPYNVAKGQLIQDAMASGISGDEIRKQSNNLKELYQGKNTYSKPETYKRLRRMMYLNPAQFKKEPIAELVNRGELSFRDGQEFLARQTEAWRADKRPPPRGVMERISNLIDEVVDGSGAEEEDAQEMYINLWNSVDKHKKDGTLGDEAIQKGLIKELTEYKESQPGYFDIITANIFRGLRGTPFIGEFAFGDIADSVAADIDKRAKDIANADISVYRYINQANNDPNGDAVIKGIMAQWAKTHNRLPTNREMNNALFEYYSQQGQ